MTTAAAEGRRFESYSSRPTDLPIAPAVIAPAVVESSAAASANASANASAKPRWVNQLSRVQKSIVVGSSVRVASGPQFVGCTGVVESINTAWVKVRLEESGERCLLRPARTADMLTNC